MLNTDYFHNLVLKINMLHIFYTGFSPSTKAKTKAFVQQ